VDLTHVIECVKNNPEAAARELIEMEKRVWPEAARIYLGLERQPGRFVRDRHLPEGRTQRGRRLSL
jgi:hypothetical protein